MIREALGQVTHIHSTGWGTAQPSPGVGSAQKKMDWETKNFNDTTPTASDHVKNQSRLDKQAFLGSVGNALGHHLNQHKEPHEIMIGMFMHTPWPSSEIFRALPSEYLCIRADLAD